MVEGVSTVEDGITGEEEATGEVEAGDDPFHLASLQMPSHHS
jgi:hypothetical protein